MATVKPNPRVLLIPSNEGMSQDPQTYTLYSDFELLVYDLGEDIEEFKRRLQDASHPYSSINAIVRIGWRNSGPFVDQTIFREDFLRYYPPTLSIICSAGHGYDWVDLDALTKRGIWYCNTPDAATEAVANTGLSLILSIYRYFTFAEHCARSEGKWMDKRQLASIADDPQGSILGVVGMGAIGAAVARKAAAALGMSIHYHNRRRDERAERTIVGGATWHQSLESLIKTSDCLCLTCPYTPESRHMVSDAQLQMAKASGLRVVNLARGQLVDEQAIIRGIEQRRVIGYGADVHENEPTISRELKTNQLVTLLPHIGVCSQSTWRNFERKCMANLWEYFKGPTMRPLTPVNTVVQDRR